MGQVISMQTRKPVERVTQVIIADPDDLLCRADLGTGRAVTKYSHVVALCNRHLRVLTNKDASLQAKHIAREFLSYTEEHSVFPQARSLARLYLRIGQRNGGAA